MCICKQGLQRQRDNDRETLKLEQTTHTSQWLYFTLYKSVYSTAVGQPMITHQLQVCSRYTRAFRVFLKFLVSQWEVSDTRTRYCGYEEVDWEKPWTWTGDHHSWCLVHYYGGIRFHKELESMVSGHRLVLMVWLMQVWNRIRITATRHNEYTVARLQVEPPFCTVPYFSFTESTRWN